MSGYISEKRISGRGPENAPFLIIGEFPDDSDEREGIVFSNKRKEHLDALLSQSGINESDCKFEFLFPFRPAGNNSGYIHQSNLLKNEIREINIFIKLHKHTLKCIIILGELGLNYLLEKKKIHLQRGSLFLYEGIKVVPTYSIDQIKKDASIYPYVCFDFQKAKAESGLPYSPLKYNFIIDPSGYQQEECINDLISNPILSNDIETDREGKYLRCSGFAKSSTDATVFVNHRYGGLSEDIISSHSRIFDSKARLIYHNGPFDVSFWHRNGLFVNNFFWDTMVAAHILNPEFSRSLAFLTSIYTNQPYYKAMVKEGEEDTKGWNDKVSIETLTEYNGLDCCVTFKIFEEQYKELSESGNQDLIDLFRYEMEMLEVGMHLTEVGMPLDLERRNLLDKTVQEKWFEKQELLNNLHRKKINVGSPKLKDLLYTELKLPVQKKRTGEVTTDEVAIVYLIGFAKGEMEKFKTQEKKQEWMYKLATLKLILEIRGLRKLLSTYLQNKYSIEDSRVRSTYKFAATETGRAAAEKYYDDTGFNAQTMPREVLEIP